jgi:glucosamine kinase
MVFVSVDGGATKTVGVCYDSSGHILGIGARGPSNFRNIGVEPAKKNIIECVKAAVERSRHGLNEVERMSFALAGVKDSAISTQIVDALVRELGFGKPYTLLNDGEAGFNCRFFSRDGVVVAAGTGMIAYIKLNGKMEKSGGWGWLIGDEGGGFYIGRRALQEAAKIADGRSDGSDEFLTAVKSFFGVSEPRRLVDEVYTSPINIRRIGLLAREVALLAGKGESTAKRLIQEAATEAALNVVALKRSLHAESLPVSGFGGVFRAGPLYWDTLKECVRRAYPNTQFIDPLYGYHAVLGSIYMILEEHGTKEFSETSILQEFNRMVETLPRQEKQEYLLLE